ncbi:hypothetical protein BMS3Bbin12_01658 [bacterium BMS3Bbin12]|nr:hypothetical protein BMS3Abin12_01394 [bacterium BMS3Abin12]GBE48480.1 hypothetical protein BMS3Bbin12_01658 [bacterium BMS3Bbin12]GBE50439.1 hypothetical protein BMS3Bbin13_01378 [bacterium BMS3Bbin13]
MTQVKNDGDLTCEDAKERRAAAQSGGGRKTDEGPPGRRAPLHRYHRSQEFRYSVLLSDAVLLPAYLV